MSDARLTMCVYNLAAYFPVDKLPLKQSYLTLAQQDHTGNTAGDRTCSEDGSALTGTQQMVCCKHAWHAGVFSQHVFCRACTWSSSTSTRMLVLRKHATHVATCCPDTLHLGWLGSTVACLMPCEGCSQRPDNQANQLPTVSVKPSTC